MRRTTGLSRLWLPVAVSASLLVLVAPAASAQRTTHHGARHIVFAKLPTPAKALISGTLGRDDRAFQVAPSPGGFMVSNARQRLTARFGRGGVLVRSGAARVGLSLASYGAGDQLKRVVAAQPTAHGNRVVYGRGQVSEWYVNGPLGLEQGFTLKAPPAAPQTTPAGTRATPTAPAGAPATPAGTQAKQAAPGGRHAGALTLALALSGNAAASLSHRTGTVSFTHGGVSLAYRGLAAHDQRGRSLPAWLELRGQELLLHINAAGARYPVTVDPFVQQAELTVSGQTGNGLGYAVAVSGNTIAAGDPSATVNGHVGQGAVFVFTEPASGWANATQTAELTSSDGAAFDSLGTSVAISGNTVVAGAPALNSPGKAYVFTEPASGWANATQTAELTSSDGVTDNEFGWSVAVSGNTVVAGEPLAEVGTTVNQGAADVFTEPASGWANATQTAELTSSDGAFEDQLGWSVAISGDTVVAGAPFAHLGSANSVGAAYVFTEPGSGWANATQTAELTSSDATAGDEFGWSVATTGDTVVAGAPGTSVIPTTLPGAAYVFAEPGSGWANATQTAKLTASDGAVGDGLGYTVGISDGTVVAGAPNATVGSNARQGAVYAFTMPTSGWADATETAKLTASDGAAGDELGYTVAISGGTAVAGAPKPAQSGQPGTVDVFLLTSPTVTCSPATAVAGQRVTCTVTIPSAGSSGPTGPVSFTSSGPGSFTGSPCTLSPAGNNSASCQVSYTPSAVGPATITASYGGDSANPASSGTATVTVHARSTSTAVGCPPGAGSFEQPITCLATVADTDVPTASPPTGTVSFTSSGPGSFTGGPCTLSPIGVGTANCQITYTPSADGPVTITVSYGGDPIHLASSGTTGLTVAKGGYVALGDSYSAGTGAPPYLASGGSCDQSGAAWPELVSSDLGFTSTFNFQACYGAVVQSLPAQEQLSASTQLVTLTIGGNNADFAPVMATCTIATSCESNWAPTVNHQIAQMGDSSSNISLFQAYKTIATQAPNAKIIVMGYPRFFPVNPPLLCYTGLFTFFFFQSQMNWINSEIQSMDTTIANAVAAVRALGYTNVHYVSGSYDAFTGHEMCTSDPYYNEVVYPQITPSFHPNQAGNARLAQLAEQAY